MPKTTPRICVERRSIDELSDAQIEQLMAFGKREAELLEEIEAAVRVGDRNLVWQLARALCQIEDEVSGPPPAA